MLTAPAHIKYALERFFPGVKLQWNPRLQWWVLSDHAVWPDGKVTRNRWQTAPGLLRGIERFPTTTRAPILYWGEIETGKRDALSLFGILNSLRRYWTGGHQAAISRGLDRLEEGEQRAEERQKSREREASRARASETWESLHRSVFGAGIRKTPWTHGRAVDKEYDERMKEQYGDSAAEADREVARRVSDGGGIAAVRRSPKQVTT
jgi:hypothetical protein